MRLTLLTTILLTAASASHAQDRPLSRAPRPGNRVILRGTDRGPNRPPVVNATVARRDFMAFYAAIARHDWGKTFRLRQAGLLLELPGGPSAVVLDFWEPAEPEDESDEPPDPMPDAVQVRILDGPRRGEAYWVPLHALSTPIGVAGPAVRGDKGE